MYLITCNTSGKQYCGLTSKTLTQRWKQHVAVANSCKGYALHNAIRCYGNEQFTLAIIANDLDLASANQVEFDTIRSLSLVENGYNCCDGGGHISKTAEVRKKIGNALRGRKLTEEHKRAIAIANSQVPKSLEHKRKLSEQKIGTKNPSKRDDVKAKIRATKRKRMRAWHSNVVEMYDQGFTFEIIALKFDIAVTTVGCLIGAHKRKSCSCQID